MKTLQEWNRLGFQVKKGSVAAYNSKGLVLFDRCQVKEFSKTPKKVIKTPTKVSNVFTDVMLDIETTGRESGCAIMQISAIPFNANTGKISTNTFSMSINLRRQELLGFRVCPNTLKWWNSENSSLFKKLSTSENKHFDVAMAFQKWFKSLEGNNTIRLWGNSARFDIGILEGWYRKILNSHSFNPFWETWNERDCRTLFRLDEAGRKKLPFIGTKHDAIDDCKHQIKCLRYIMKKFNLKIT